MTPARDLDPPPDQSRHEATKPRRPVLVVEDSPIVALDLAQVLEQEGFTVIGPALNLEEGLRLASIHGPELHWAVLDFDLGGRNAGPIATALAQWAVPIVWCSGFSEGADPAFLQGVHLQKPIEHASLVRLLRGDDAQR